MISSFSPDFAAHQTTAREVDGEIIPRYDGANSPIYPPDGTLDSDRDTDQVIGESQEPIHALQGDRQRQLSFEDTTQEEDVSKPPIPPELRLLIDAQRASRRGPQTSSDQTITAQFIANRADAIRPVTPKPARRPRRSA